VFSLILVSLFLTKKKVEHNIIILAQSVGYSLTFVEEKENSQENFKLFLQGPSTVSFRATPGRVLLQLFGSSHSQRSTPDVTRKKRQT